MPLKSGAFYIHDIMSARITQTQRVPSAWVYWRGVLLLLHSWQNASTLFSFFKIPSRKIGVWGRIVSYPAHSRPAARLNTTWNETFRWRYCAHITQIARSSPLGPVGFSAWVRRGREEEAGEPNKKQPPGKLTASLDLFRELEECEALDWIWEWRKIGVIRS